MNIFLCEPIHEDAYIKLKQNNNIIHSFEYIHQCEIVISRNLKIDKHFIDQCPLLQLIVIHGTGYDNVDIEYVKQKHIHLVNTPGQNTLSVSELIITMMLELSRQTLLLEKDFKKNKINSIAPIQYLGHEISNKVFGMIGVGNIALQTAQILKNGFHMKIIGYSRSLTKEKAQQFGIEYCETMDDVFKQSDYISIGTSLNSDTYHMITKNQLSLMKSTAYLINTARGAIIDEDDLYEVLKDRKIAGAGLDVLEDEPISYNHRLLQLDNVVYTPHIGASTEESLRRVGMAVVDVIEQYKTGKNSHHLLF